FGAPLGARSVVVYGGAPKVVQAGHLSRGADIVVATPAAVPRAWRADRMRGQNRSSHTCEQADRMLDMGFEKDIRALVAAIPAVGRQTLLFTATWPKAVQRVADPRSGVRISLLQPALLTANPSVEQRVAVLGHPRDKWEAFLQLVEPFRKGGGEAATRVIVFCNTKKDVNGIGEHLYNDGFSVDTCSGDRTQRERERVIQSFRDGAVTMVIATDVAARGLDIQGIDRVINYDYPPGEGGSDDYIHRIGRTGRAGAKGRADTLFTH
ncbi:hypothetical protein EMIHUDRAFT_55878, partial [Emiliania huxleyi CCMP1516]|uniref:RNA helicase n=2 Tax=Emiliania huxleyi TaxID=2903 RepID=A0A0D3J2E9_EMIH1